MINIIRNNNLSSCKLMNKEKIILLCPKKIRINNNNHIYCLQYKNNHLKGKMRLQQLKENQFLDNRVCPL